MKIRILGACSGTEPMPGMHHTAWVLETDHELYWFDAGEGCAHTAYLLGLDLLKVKHIFLTHPHMDHIGGLPHLLWSFQKLLYVNKLDIPMTVVCHTPDRKVLDGVKMILQAEGRSIDAVTADVRPGLLLDDPEVRVEARPNTHLKIQPGEPCRSFSYRITAGGRKIVCSGDVGTVDDLGEWLEDCDLLMMETGHHIASEVCAKLRRDKRGVRNILFYHHGREIIGDRAGAIARAEAAWGGPVGCASDGMCIDLDLLP